MGEHPNMNPSSHPSGERCPDCNGTGQRDGVRWTCARCVLCDGTGQLQPASGRLSKHIERASKRVRSDPLYPAPTEQPGEARVAILVPLYKRVEQMERLSANLAEVTPEATIYLRIVEGITPAYAPAENCAVVLSKTTRYGEGINLLARHARADGFPYLFVGADDLHFHPGWYDAALAKMRGEVMAVGTNDMGNPRVIAGAHSTHFLVDTDYLQLGTIDAPDCLLSEAYWHQCVDDEFRATAISRGMWDHAHDSLVEHLHPVWGKADVDSTYERGASRYDADVALWEKRAEQFGLYEAARKVFLR